MNGALGDRRPDDNGTTLTAQLTAVDTALATGDVAAALRASHELYGATFGACRWEGFAEAGDAFLRIARALGSPARGMARARDLYMSALVRAGGAGSLDGVLRIASAFVELGDDEIVTQPCGSPAVSPARAPSPSCTTCWPRWRATSSRPGRCCCRGAPAGVDSPPSRSQNPRR
jgi:hypothetical protein